MFFSQKKDTVGVDIGSNAVKIVQLKEQKGTWQLVNAGIVPLPSEAVVDNSLMDTAAIVDAVKNAMQSLGIKEKGKVASCSISGNSVIIRKIILPTMPSEELEDQISWEAEQYIPFDVNDVNIDFQILHPDATDPGRMHVLLVASKKEVINDYLGVFSQSGVPLGIIDVDAFAVQNAFELNHDTAEEDVVALVNIGASFMNINIVKSGISLFTRDVQTGGNLYSEEIQKQLAVSGDEAESMKVVADDSSTRPLLNVFNKINESIGLEVRRSLDFYNSTALQEDRITRIVLSGGAIKAYRLKEKIQELLDLPVDVLNPFAKLKISDKEFDQEYLQELAPIMAVAVGLATRRIGDK